MSWLDNYHIRPFDSQTENVLNLMNKITFRYDTTDYDTRVEIQTLYYDFQSNNLALRRNFTLERLNSSIAMAKTFLELTMKNAKQETPALMGLSRDLCGAIENIETLKKNNSLEFDMLNSIFYELAILLRDIKSLHDNFSEKAKIGPDTIETKEINGLNLEYQLTLNSELKSQLNSVINFYEKRFKKIEYLKVFKRAGHSTEEFNRRISRLDTYRLLAERSD